MGGWKEGSGAGVLTGALSPQGAEHAVPPGQGRRRRAARPAGPLALLFPGPVVAGGGGAARGGEPGPAAAAAAWVRGGRPPRPAGRAAAARAAGVRRGAEDENRAEEALQGLLHRAAAGTALHLLQDQPPAQAAEAVARRPGWGSSGAGPPRGEDEGGGRASGGPSLLRPCGWARSLPLPWLPRELREVTAGGTQIAKWCR